MIFEHVKEQPMSNTKALAALAVNGGQPIRTTA